MALEDKKIVRTVFEYLNGLQLSKAAQVCRFWNKIAEEEKKKRSPFALISHRESKKPPPPWIIVKKEIIDSCPFKPYFNIFFIATGCERRNEQECHCKFLPSNCYSLSLETFFPIENVDIIKSMFFPKVPHIKMSTISLNEHSRVKGIYCKELDFEFDLFWNGKEKLKDLYDPFLTCDSRYSVCMLLFCDQLSIRLTDDVIKLLQSWYPTKQVSVWGGMLHELTICNNYPPNQSCQASMNLVSILLSGRNMETWFMSLGPYYRKTNRISYRFKIFSLSVRLRKHSIGFMFTSDNRGEKFYYFEASQFEKHFPRTPLVKICGMTAIGGENFKEIYRKIMDHKKLLKGKETIFMIISYDY